MLTQPIGLAELWPRLRGGPEPRANNPRGSARSQARVRRSARSRTWIRPVSQPRRSARSRPDLGIDGMKRRDRSVLAQNVPAAGTRTDDGLAAGQCSSRTQFFSRRPKRRPAPEPSDERREQVRQLMAMPNTRSSRESTAWRARRKASRHCPQLKRQQLAQPDAEALAEDLADTFRRCQVQELQRRDKSSAGSRPSPGPDRRQPVSRRPQGRRSRPSRSTSTRPAIPTSGASSTRTPPAQRRRPHRGDAQLLPLSRRASGQCERRSVRRPHRGRRLPLERRAPAGPDRYRRQAHRPVPPAAE